MRLRAVAAQLPALAFAGFLTLAMAQSKGGRWQFENNGLDTAEWDIAEDNGTLQNQATYASTPPLQEGEAYLWLDSNQQYDFFKIADSPDLDFDNESIGISAWIHPVLLARVHFLVCKGDQFPTPKTTNYALRIAESRKLEFLLRDANDRAQRVTSSFTIPLNQWTFVAAFYDFPAGKVYFWNHPALPAVDTLSFSQPIFSNNDPLSLGSWFRSDPAAPSITDFEGRLDDVRISGRLQDLFPPATAVRAPRFGVVPLVPEELVIYPNPIFPNGVTETATVTFYARLGTPAALAVYNLLGGTVFAATVVSPAYPLVYRWDLRDRHGRRLETGIYWARLDNGRQLVTQRFLLLQ